jgi:hypothetical protein
MRENGATALVKGKGTEDHGISVSAGDAGRPSSAP